MFTLLFITAKNFSPKTQKQLSRIVLYLPYMDHWNGWDSNTLHFSPGLVDRPLTHTYR